MHTFSLHISYAQIAVFDPRLTNPFNDWSQVHVDQGFSWRPGSVSFATLEPGGPVTVTVSRSEGPLAMTTAPERAILVPFSVADSGIVEIASITDSASVQLAVGEYALTYEHGRGSDGHMWVAFTFAPAALPVRPELLRADAALRPPPELLMAADPA